MTQKVYALVDCNSFFCSCERVFRPDLIGKPVGVLSNNDGCFIARTPELKALGVKMGEPYFKVKKLCDKFNVSVFSSNFSLYTNMSDRVMSILSSFAPQLEVYSVDEAFLDLTGLQCDLDQYARHIKEVVYRWTGIPVSVGIGSSKTLAKLANSVAKKSLKAKGVVNLREKRLQDIALKMTEIQDVWGIGAKSSAKLRALGIKSALDFRDYSNEKNIQRILTKLGRMTQDELRGASCFELETVIQEKKEIMCSRSFGSPVMDLKDLRESIANYATLACERMRAQKSSCARIDIFCHSNPFDTSMETYYAKDHIKLDVPTLDSRRVIKYALEAAQELFKAGVNYKKAGVCLSGFSKSDNIQPTLFNAGDSEKSKALMRVVDQINNRDGQGTIRSMACGVDDQAWKMRRELLSSRFVTGWSELPKCS